MRNWKLYHKSDEGITYQIRWEDDERSELNVGKQSDDWVVSYKSKGFATEHLGRFEEKENALNFAKRWMKSHPKG